MAKQFTGITSPYTFRKLADGTWQRRRGTGPWQTLTVTRVPVNRGARNKHRNDVPPFRYDWSWS